MIDDAAHATFVYGDLIRRHMKEARRDFDGPERQRLFALIEEFRATYPAECEVWENWYRVPVDIPTPPA